MLSAERYGQAKRVFLEAAGLPREERTRFLHSRCGEDGEMEALVRRLLAADEGDPEFLSTPAMGESGSRGGLAAGTRLGGFRVVRLLGEGGMGVVYEAEQDEPGRRVALKLIRPGFVSERLRSRFRHEIRVLGQLRHPGIAQIYEAGTVELAGDEVPYFAMELVEGRPLLEAAREMGVRDRLGLIAQLCDAVHHAHQKAVIHRDLKPGNILVDEGGRARVLDFGVARLAAPDAAASLATMPGQVIGTLAYMSPEQAAGDPDAVDARADIYALGAVGYELLAGRPALDVSRLPIPEALRAVQEQNPVRLGALDRRLRGDAETIIAAAMEKDPRRRYPSAAGMAGDLRRALGDEPILARPPTAMYRMRKFARRRRGLVAAAGAVALALIAGVIMSTVFAVRADAQRARAERRLEDVRALANTFLFDVHDLIAPLAGSIQARRLLVQTGLEYLDSLAAEPGDDYALLAELAAAYTRIGDIQGNPRGPNLGDVESALASHERALAIRRRLAETLRTAGAARALAGAEIAAGETAAASDRASTALDHYHRARALLEGLDGESQTLAALALSNRRLAESLRAQGRPDEALPHALASLEAAERMFAAGVGDAAIEQLALGAEEVGQTLTRMGRPAEAAPHQQRSLLAPIRRQSEIRTQAQVSRDVAAVHHRLASVSAGEGDYARAYDLCRRALELLGSVAAADPSDAGARFDLSRAHERVGDSLAGLGRWGEAAGAYRSAAETVEALSAQHPDNLLYRGAHAGAVERLARARRELGEFDGARARYEEAIQLARRCIESDPTDARTWTLVAAAQRGLGEVALAESGEDPARLAAARGWLGQSMATLKEMRRLGMSPVRADVNEEQVRALLARSGAGAGG